MSEDPGSACALSCSGKVSWVMDNARTNSDGTAVRLSLMPEASCCEAVDRLPRMQRRQLFFISHGNASRVSKRYAKVANRPRIPRHVRLRHFLLNPWLSFRAGKNRG